MSGRPLGSDVAARGQGFGFALKALEARQPLGFEVARGDRRPHSTLRLVTMGAVAEPAVVCEGVDVLEAVVEADLRTP